MIYVLGANGQLGGDICDELDRYKIEYAPLTRNELDITSESDIELFFKNKDISSIINCTSYHKTEEVEENASKAFFVNCKIPKKLSQVCKKKGARLFHFSTDYVFGGNKTNEPINEATDPSPLNVYGMSKFIGEELALKYKNTYIFRVSSLFGVRGASGKGGNFVEAIIKNAKENGEISVVDDQIMSPTSTSFIAKVTCKFILNSYEPGIYHIANKGCVTWYEFAMEICKQCSIEVSGDKLKSSDLALKAKRPNYSVLSTDKLKSLDVLIPSYEVELKEYLIKKQHIK